VERDCGRLTRALAFPSPVWARRTPPNRTERRSSPESSSSARRVTVPPIGRCVFRRSEIW